MLPTFCPEIDPDRHDAANTAPGSESDGIGRRTDREDRANSAALVTRSGKDFAPIFCMTR
jgi:hypothetical protein